MTFLSFDVEKQGSKPKARKRKAEELEADAREQHEEQPNLAENDTEAGNAAGRKPSRGRGGGRAQSGRGRGRGRKTSSVSKVSFCISL